MGGALHGDKRARARAQEPQGPRRPRGRSARARRCATSAASCTSPDDDALRRAGRRAAAHADPREGQAAARRAQRHGRHRQGAVVSGARAATRSRCASSRPSSRTSSCSTRSGASCCARRSARRSPTTCRPRPTLLPKAITVRDRRGREDLRAIPLLTIDPEDARDHDDAVCAERLPGGGYPRAGRHRRRLALRARGQRARPRSDRARLHHLPADRAIPMLPPELSSNLARSCPSAIA